MTDNRKLVLRFAAFAVLAGAALLFLFLQFTGGEQSTQSVSAQRQRWLDQGIEDYRAQVHISLGTVCQTVDYTVRGGVLVEAFSADPAAGFLVDGDPYEPDNPAYEEAPVALIQPYTLDALFDLAQDEINALSGFSFAGCSRSNYDITYDAGFGYIRSFTIIDEQGLCNVPVCDTIYCCPPGFRVLNFEPLDAESTTEE